MSHVGASMHTLKPGSAYGISQRVAGAWSGAIRAGDIGQHFPDTDESIRGISSIEILKRVNELLAQTSARVVNIDATLLAEEPKFAPHIAGMRKAIADALDT